MQFEKRLTFEGNKMISIKKIAGAKEHLINRYNEVIENSKRRKFLLILAKRYPKLLNSNDILKIHELNDFLDGLYDKTYLFSFIS
jgi:hypothetical protein